MILNFHHRHICADADLIGFLLFCIVVKPFDIGFISHLSVVLVCSFSFLPIYLKYNQQYSTLFFLRSDYTLVLLFPSDCPTVSHFFLCDIPDGNIVVDQCMVYILCHFIILRNFVCNDFEFYYCINDNVQMDELMFSCYLIVDLRRLLKVSHHNATLLQSYCHFHSIISGEIFLMHYCRLHTVSS